MSDRVAVSRPLLTIGGIVLVGSLTLSAFLLGRVSAPVAPVVVQAPAAPAAPLDHGASSVGATAPATPAPPSVPVAEPASAGGSPSPTDADDSAAVRAYFQSLDGEESSILDGLDPQTLVQQALAGDASGVDRLIEKHKQRMDRIARLSVPEPCRTHHTELLALGRDGLAVMTRLRDGIASNDLHSLAALQGDAGRLQRATDQLNKREDELRQRYGA